MTSNRASVNVGARRNGANIVDISTIFEVEYVWPRSSRLPAASRHRASVNSVQSRRRIYRPNTATQVSLLNSI